MKKAITLVAAAALASPLAIATAAAGDLEIYGRAHISIDHLDDRDDSSQHLMSNSSRLGVRGSEYLGMGLTGIFQYETRVRLTEAGDLFDEGRTSYLGLQGPFGTLMGGRLDDPLKTAVDRNNYFADQLGDAHNLLRPQALFEEEESGEFVTSPVGGNNVRHNNVLAYVTPDFQGFTGTVVYGPKQGTDKGDRFVVEARYDNQVGLGNLFVSLGYLQANEGVVDDLLGLEEGDEGFGEAKHKVWQLLASYTVSDAWRVMAVYQDYGATDLDLLEDDDDVFITQLEDDRVFGLGVGFYVAPQVELKGHVMHHDADARNADSTMYAAGLDYHITDRTTLYGVYSIINNDDNAARVMSNYGHGSGTTQDGEGFNVGPGDNQWGLSMGVIHNF